MMDIEHRSCALGSTRGDAGRLRGPRGRRPSTARPVAPAVETDKVQARLAHEVVAAGIRHDFHADRGLLPR